MSSAKMTDHCINGADIEAMEPRYRANFVNCLSGFKGACLVGTSHAREQQENLAIVSSVVHVGANPPLLGMVMRPHTVVRDTLRNIKANGVYTLNQVQCDWVEQAHQTSARYPSGVSEFAETGLTAWYADTFEAPFVAQSPLKLAMKLETIIPIEVNNTEFVVGRIEQVWLNEDQLDTQGRIDLSQLEVACISGLDTYHQPRRIARFAYAKPQERAEKAQYSSGT